MKRTLLLVSGILLLAAVSAQAPQGITNQAVIRNSNNELMSNAAIGIKVSILHGGFEGNAVYVETHNVMSNAAGLITYIIGEGVVESGQFAAIEWANGPYFLKTEVDTDGGTNYTMSGTSQMLSVPYALEAKHASSLSLTDDSGNKYQITVDENGNLTSTQIVQPWQCGQPFTDTRDGKAYNTVQIGEQCWMKKNMNYATINSWCYDNNNDNCDNYGRLYTWNAALAVCPSGWHLTGDTEWTQLVDYLMAQGFPNDNVSNGAGNALKSCRQVGSPLGDECNTSEHPRWDSHGTHHGFDETGFSAFPGGYRNIDGSFGIPYNGYWWTWPETSSSNAWYRGIFLSTGDVYRSAINKGSGLSVRCLRD
jgi:uncharacterized protein (TIGR02145 family)